MEQLNGEGDDNSSFQTSTIDPEEHPEEKTRIGLETYITADEYGRIPLPSLTTKVINYLVKILFRDYHFQQDKDSKHTAHLVSDWLAQNVSNQLKTPSQLQNLSPIGYLWS